MKPLFAFLLLLVGAMGGHYLLADRGAQAEAIGAVVELSGFSQPALGVAWYAPRRLVRDVPPANPAYPELGAVMRSDFVYAE